MTRVLVVDDEPSFLEISKTILEKIHRLEVITTPYPGEVMNILKEYPVDVIVSDYQMPGTSGCALVQLIRGDPRWKNLPVIMFTGRSREEEVVAAMNAGADFYLQKGGDPASQFAELNETITRAIARRSAEPARTEK